jgi:hypothetical protein
MNVNLKNSQPQTAGKLQQLIPELDKIAIEFCGKIYYRATQIAERFSHIPKEIIRNFCEANCNDDCFGDNTEGWISEENIRLLFE